MLQRKSEFREKLYFFLCFVVSISLSEVCAAQEDPLVMVQTDRRQMGLALGESIALKFSSPFSEVFVANPNIADVHVFDGANILIRATREGFTSIVFKGESGTIAVRDLSVWRSTPRSSQSFSPHPINVRTVEIPPPSTVITEGSTKVERKEAKIIQEKYLCPGNGAIGCVLDNSEAISSRGGAATGQEFNGSKR